MEKVVDSYNSQAKCLSRAMVKKTTGTDDEYEFFRNNARLSTLIASDPMYLIRNTGRYLLDYSAEIKAQDWDSFRKIDIEATVAKRGGDVAVIQILSKLAQLAEKMTEKEKELIATTVCGMLDNYCRFVRLLGGA